MAILLGAFLIHGLVPGPDMVTTNLSITYSMVWSIAIANILAAGICFLLERPVREARDACAIRCFCPACCASSISVRSKVSASGAISTRCCSSACSAGC